MHTFTTLLEKFGPNGEKTNWTYVEIPTAVTDALRPGRRTSFRVSGSIDHYVLARVALLPTGEGTFILPVNAGMRRAIGKQAGALVTITLETADEPQPLSADLLACLADDPAANAFFGTLPPGHQRYFSTWIESAKTPATKTKRLTQAVVGLALGLGYGEMIRYFKTHSV